MEVRKFYRFIHGHAVSRKFCIPEDTDLDGRITDGAGLVHDTAFAAS